MFQKVLNPFFKALLRLIGFNRLTISNLHKEYQYVLELIAHNCLYIQHILNINFIAFNLKKFIKVMPIRLHLNNLFKILRPLSIEHISGTLLRLLILLPFFLQLMINCCLYLIADSCSDLLESGVVLGTCVRDLGDGRLEVGDFR